MANFVKQTSEKGSIKGGELNPKHETPGEHPPTIHLGHEHLKALGLHKGPMPKVGSKIKISGLVHVGSTSENADSMQEPGRKEGTGATTPKNTRHMTLHLHKMEMGTGKQSTEVNDEDQKEGMKGEIDKALAREMGGKKSNDEEGGEGKTRTARGNNGPTG